MENPQLASFLRALPPSQRPNWAQFIDSLSKTQQEMLGELSVDITVKPRASIDTDGLGTNLQGRIVDIKAVQKQHIKLEGDDKPFPALVYNRHTYSLFRTLHDWASVEKITSRLRVGYLVTETPKGWVVWVHEQA
jgi:hypothetical protein